MMNEHTKNSFPFFFCSESKGTLLDGRTNNLILTRNKQVTIIQERYYCKGAIRMGGEVKDNEGYPTDEDLERARLFGEKLKEQL